MGRMSHNGAENMTNSKILAILAVAIIAVAGVGVAFYVLQDGDKDERTDDETPDTPDVPDVPVRKTVIDALDREVEIPKKIDKIFCIGAGSLRLISYFDSVDKVKALEATGTFNELDGQTYFVVHKEKFRDLPRIPVGAESLILHNPDLIITASTDKTAVNNLSTQTGKPVFAIDSMLEFGDEFDEHVKVVGKLIGEEARAQALVDGIGTLLKDVTSKVTGESAAKAYACGMFFYGGSEFLKASGNYQPFEFSKIKNVQPPSENKQPYKINEETFLTYNPDYIFIDNIDRDNVLNFIFENYETYKNVPAVKNFEIYSCMVYKCYNTNWENQLINAFYVASVINGDLYDWNFEAKADAVMELFYPDSAMRYADLEDAQRGCEYLCEPQ